MVGLDTEEMRSERLADEKLHVGEKTALARLHRSLDAVVLDE